MRGNALLHALKYLFRLEQPETQTTLLEQELLEHYAQGAKTVVEIGVFEGVNSANIIQAMASEGTFWGIDPFFPGKLGVSYSEWIAKSWVNRHKPKPKVKFIKKLSFVAVNDVPNDLDFIFIDGDHSLEGIAKDWEDWSKKVRVGGIIALHDTSVPNHNPSVANLGSYKYFNEHIKFDAHFKIVDSCDSLNVLKRVQ